MRIGFAPPIKSADEEDEIDRGSSGNALALLACGLFDRSPPVKYPLLGSMVSLEATDPIYVVRPERKLIRSQQQIRSAYFTKLGIGAGMVRLLCGVVWLAFH